MPSTIVSTTPLTVRLNNGVEVLGKLYKGEPCALGYANRTQALNKLQEVGEEWELRQWGRPIYVARKRLPKPTV